MKVYFPRIHSLSTVGIIYHFNADYLFHPFRTDFTGEGGSGKTMIADMIQLILVGSGNYHSATEGNDKRPIDGMVVQAKQRQYGAGYLIMNIEVSPGKYLAIGCFIEKSSKQSKMFIAQAGYDWDRELEFLRAPAYYKDFLVNDRIVSVEELNKTLQHIHLKPLSTKVYHRLLYENGIINIDLSNKKKLDSYANIFRSFSRGKGLKTGSENLKDFLFGDDEKMHMASYQQQVKSISDDFQEHDRYQKEIELIGQKEGYIKEIVKLQSTYKSFEESYRTEKAFFWNQQAKQAHASHDICQLNYTRVSIERACLRLHSATLEHEELKNYVDSYKANQEKLQKLKGQFEGVEEKKSNHYSQLGEIETKLKQIAQLELLISENGDLEALQMKIEFEGKFAADRTLLQKFQSHLKNENIINEFAASAWSEDYEGAILLYDSDHQLLNKKIHELQELQVFQIYRTQNLSQPGPSIFLIAP